jgi:nicotinate dehydrogenase subunit B
MIVAEELALPIEKVRIELGETDTAPWDFGTFGSMSTATDGAILRSAAIRARRLLIERAAALFGLPVSALGLEGGRVVAPDGRSTTFAELTADAPLTGKVPESPAGAGAAASTVAAASHRIEAVDIVTGRARYPADIRLAGMVRGHRLNPPQPDLRLASLDDRAASAMPGVIAIVRDGDFVGVVADRDEQALAAVEALRAEWAVPAGRPEGAVDAVLRRDAGTGAALAGASLRLDARYRVPHIAHASIGPSAAVADVRPDGADLYVATQRPFALRDAVAELLDLAPERVHIHPQTMSGMYGRGNMADAAIDAVRLSRAVARPVLVQWTRAEEFRLSPHRPLLDAEMSAGLDASGRIAAWRYEAHTNPHTYGEGSAPPGVVEMTSGRNALPPYRLGQAEVLVHVARARLRTGAFRSLAAAPHVFAIESFVDELAHLVGEDPIAFRLRHVEDARLRRVLETVRSMSHWESRPRPPGRGLGVASVIYHGTYVAEIAEVAIDPAGNIRLERVWCAVDAGRLVNPDGAQNQIEGGIQQAVSWTMLEELREDDGAVMTSSWHDYPIARCKDAPRAIDVRFCGDAETPSTGVGEPGSVPTAAAIANAVFDASGSRLRRLPLAPPTAVTVP